MTRIRFEDLPSTNTPRNAENLNKLNNVVISSTEPITGEEVWIQDTEEKIYFKNDDDVYEELKFDNVTKNLFVPLELRTTTPDLKLSYDNGIITFNGSTTYPADIFFNGSDKDTKGVILDGTYTISVKIVGGTITSDGDTNIYLKKNDGSSIYDGTSIFSFSLNKNVQAGTVFKKTFTTNKQRLHLIGYTASMSCNNFQLEIQIEKNNKKTYFSPFMGVIIDSGSNENGSYVKYSDGTMIQTGIYNTNSKEFTKAYGNVFYDGLIHTITYPQPFTSVTGLSFTPTLHGGMGGISLYRHDLNISRIYVYSVLSYTFTENVTIPWIAIGRWK